MSNYFCLAMSCQVKHCLEALLVKVVYNFEDRVITSTVSNSISVQSFILRVNRVAMTQLSAWKQGI